MTPDPISVSFEVSPARAPAAASAVWDMVRTLAAARPDLISITYGSEPSSRAASVELAGRLLAETPIPPMAHLSCSRATRAELAETVRRLLAAGVRHFLALRGDPPAGQQEWVPAPGGVAGTVELVALVREIEAHEGAAGPVAVAVAAHPATAGRSPEAELANLRRKQEAGADLAISQLFFAPADYLDLVARTAAAGLTLPVLAGIVPLTEPARLHRLARLTGVPVPDRVTELLDVPDPAERLRRGTDATLHLVREVLDAGAPGVHVYTLNQPRPALAVLEEVRARSCRAPHRHRI